MGRKGPGQSEEKSIQVSRRSFIELAIGSITMVPAVIAAAPTGTAFAEEAAETSSGDGTTTLTVAKPSQVNVVIYDVTNDGKARVRNATVTFRSSNSKDPIVANTGSSGVVTIDIEKLADPEGLKKDPKEYQFFGTISVTADGYRSFRSGLLQFKGATVVQGATRKLERDWFYPALCTFNGFDILYYTSTFIRSTANKRLHVLEIEIENAGTKEITFKLQTADGKELENQTVKPSNGVAKFTIKKHFLQYGHASALPEAKTFVARYEQDDKWFTHVLHLAIDTAPADAQGPIDLSNVSLAPLLFNALDMNMGVKFPDSIPIIGGSTLKPPWPELPVHVGLDPFGYVRVSVRTPEWGIKNSSSMASALKKNDEKALTEEMQHPLVEHSIGDSFDNPLLALDDDDSSIFQGKLAGASSNAVEDDISWMSREHWKKAWTDKWKDFGQKWKDGVDGFNRSREGKGGENRNSSRTINWSKKFSFTVMGQVTGWGEWRSGREAYQKGLADENYWRCGLALQGILQLNFDYMWNIWVWVIPVVIGVGVNASVTVGYATGLKTPSLKEFDKYTWDFGSDGFSISLKIIPYFSIGIGVADVASVSLKISANLTWYLGCGAIMFNDSVKDKYKNLPMPHMTAGGALQGAVVVQVWLFTWSFPLTKGPGLGWPKLYDNWRVGNEWNTTPEGKMAWQALADGDLSALAGADPNDPNAYMTDRLGSLEEFMQKAAIISEGSLTGVAEVKKEDEIKAMSEDELLAMGDEDVEEYYFVDYSDTKLYPVDYKDTLVDVYDDDYIPAGDDDPFQSMDYWYMPWSEAERLVKEMSAQGSELSAQGVEDEAAPTEESAPVAEDQQAPAEATSAAEDQQAPVETVVAAEGQQAQDTTSVADASATTVAATTVAAASVAATDVITTSADAAATVQDVSAQVGDATSTQAAVPTDAAASGLESQVTATPDAASVQDIVDTQSAAATDATTSQDAASATSASDATSAPTQEVPTSEADASPTEAASSETPAEDAVLAAQAAEPQKTKIPSPKARQVGDHGYQNIPKGASIKERGPELGLIPDQDVRLMDGVLSESRARVVNVMGFTFLFRIGTVIMGGQTRSRVMYSLLDANCGVDSYNRYIDFDYSRDSKGYIFAKGAAPGPNSFDYVADYRQKSTAEFPPRGDYFDYDFDVYVEPIENNAYERNRGEKWARLHLVIVSGRRPQGDSTSIAEALDNPVVTYLRYDVLIKYGGYGSLIDDPNSVFVQGWPTFARTARVQELFKNAGIFKTYPDHNISCPQIQRLENTDDKGNYHQTLLITYLDRAAASRDQLITENVNIFMGAMFAEIGDRKSLTIVKADDLSSKLGVAGADGAIRSLYCSKRLSSMDGDYLNNKHLIMFRSTTSVHYFFMEASACVKHKGNKKLIENPKYDPNNPNSMEPEFILDKRFAAYYAPEIVSVKRYEVGEGVKLPMLVEWPDHEGYLGVENGKLQQYLWKNTDTDTPMLVATDVGPEGFEVSGFGCDSTGNFLYYPSSREGNADYSSTKQSDVDENGNYVDGEFEDGEPLADYRIMACKFHGGRFCEPFVFAELDHSVDMLEVVPTSPLCMGFVATTMVEPEKGKGEIWYTAMPNVRSLTVLTCDALSEFVFPGEKCLLSVSVRNDGNTYLKGFTARMRDLTAGVTYDEEVQVTFNKETLLESGYNPAVEGSTTGELQNVESDWSLAPGRCAQYQVEFTVPKDWKGSHRVTVLASNALVADSDSAVVPMAALAAMAEGDEGSDMGLVAQAEEVIPYDADWSDDLAPWDELDVTPDEELEALEDAPMQTEDGGAPAPADGGSREVLPRTGDSSILSTAATIAGAAGAAMLAYSHRRTRIEREMRRHGIDLDD